MKGWLQGRFTVSIVDVLVEKIAGTRPARQGEGVEVVIDFKRPRKTDADADGAIRLWLEGLMNKEIATQLQLGQTYVSRLLRIGAERMGTTLEALARQRKVRPPDPSRVPGYQSIADEVKRLWWDELFPAAVVARKLRCSTTTVKAAVRFWFESRGLSVPTFELWLHKLHQRVLTLFDENLLEIQAIGESVHIGRTKVMEIVRDGYRRLGKELPDGRTRRSQLHDERRANG